MIMAQFSTRYFSFTAFGTDHASAEEALRDGWEAHRRATGASYTFDDLQDGVEYLEAVAGRCVRDGVPLVEGTPSPPSMPAWGHLRGVLKSYKPPFGNWNSAPPEVWAALEYVRAEMAKTGNRAMCPERSPLTPNETPED